MERISVLAFVALGLFVGCGSDQSTESTSSTDPAPTATKPKETDSPVISPPPTQAAARPQRAASGRWAALERAAAGEAALLMIPSGPPPKKVIARDLKRGSGEEIKPGDWFTVKYLALDYRTGRPFEDRWKETSRWIFGTGEINEGWEIGLKGMRVGGLRELLVPGYLAYTQQGALVYLVKLLKAENPTL